MRAPSSIALEELKAAVEIAHDNFKHVAAHAHACRGIENCSRGRRRQHRALHLRRRGGAEAHCRERHLRRADDLRRRAADPRQQHGAVHARAPAKAHARSSTTSTSRRSSARIEMGARIAMGTDAGTPGNHHGMNASECVFMVRDAGMTAAESIHAATINPARLLRQEKQSRQPGGRQVSPTSSPAAAIRSTTSRN